MDTVLFRRRLATFAAIAAIGVVAYFITASIPPVKSWFGQQVAELVLPVNTVPY